MLFFSRRFLPLFLTQFLGAFNDNLFKNALVMLVIFRASGGQDAQAFVTLATGLFMLPYFLFSATAGQLADKYARAELSRVIKLVEILLALFASAGFFTGHVMFLMIVLFWLGTQATFFGPIKYALLPQHLKEDELLTGNAWIEGGTFLAILLGTICGGLLILQPQGAALTSALMIACAVGGYIVSRYIPPAPAPEPALCIRWNIFKETIHILHFARRDRTVFVAILGISWFWLLGGAFLSQFPAYAKDILHADETVVTLFLTVFSLGIGIGSMLCSALSKGHIRLSYVTTGMIGISFFTTDFYDASQHAFLLDTNLASAHAFIAHAANLRILTDLFFISVCGGLYIVPLYALIQSKSPAEQRARIIAANNVINSLFMVISALLIVFLLKLKFTIPEIFLTLAIANCVATVYVYSRLK